MWLVFILFSVGLTIFLMGYRADGDQFTESANWWKAVIAWCIALLFI